MIRYNLVLKLFIKPNKKIMYAIENQETVLEYLYKTKAAQPSSCGIIHAIYNTRESSGVDFKADPVPDPDFFISMRIQIWILVRLLNFYSILKVGNRSKKHTCEGTTALLKGRKPGLFLNFGKFPCF
jgi:hypothetical protein